MPRCARRRPSRTASRLAPARWLAPVLTKSTAGRPGSGRAGRQCTPTSAPPGPNATGRSLNPGPSSGAGCPDAGCPDAGWVGDEAAAAFVPAAGRAVASQSVSRAQLAHGVSVSPGSRMSSA